MDNRTVFDPAIPGFSEAYYIIWTDPNQALSMVVRYVLFNGPTDETRIAEVWCWFRDTRRGTDVAVRQRYPLAAARIARDRFDLRIGNASGINDHRAWGTVRGGGGEVRWDFDLAAPGAIALDRLPGLVGHEMFPRFYSPGCKRTLSATVTANGAEYRAGNVPATDGHYWNTHQLRTWSWANCVRFQEDPAGLFEAIGFRLYAETAPVAVSAGVVLDGRLSLSPFPAAMYLNRETASCLERWVIEASFDKMEVHAELAGNPEDMILIVHPLPDGNFLHTTITLNASARLEVTSPGRDGGRVTRVLHCAAGASFEVTKPERNPRVTREFQVVAAPAEFNA